MSLVPYASSSSSSSPSGDDDDVEQEGPSEQHFFGSALSDRPQTSPESLEVEGLTVPNSAFWRGSGDAILDTALPPTAPAAPSRPRNLAGVRLPGPAPPPEDVAGAGRRRPLEVAPGQLLAGARRPSRCPRRARARAPQAVALSLAGHGGAARRAAWSPAPALPGLAASCALDGSVLAWDLLAASARGQPAARLPTSGAAVRACAWAPDGQRLLHGGLGRATGLWDLAADCVAVEHFQTSPVNSLAFDPLSPSVYLAAGVDQLSAWDLRQRTPVRVFRHRSGLGEVNDAVFLGQRGEFMAACDVVSRNSADRTLIVFDVGSGSVVSGQIFEERFTVTRLSLPPGGRRVFAQTQGDYVLCVSSSPPYRVAPPGRAEGLHRVGGFPVGADVSPDGALLLSGSADGRAAVYDARWGTPLHAVAVGGGACVDVRWHPLLPSTALATGWDGGVHLLR